MFAARQLLATPVDIAATKDGETVGGAGGGDGCVGSGSGNIGICYGSCIAGDYRQVGISAGQLDMRTRRRADT